MAASVEIEFDPEHLEFLSLEPGPFMGRASGNRRTLISLKNVDAENGRLSLLLGRIDPAGRVLVNGWPALSRPAPHGGGKGTATP